MPEGIYRFRIGSFDCSIVSDGEFEYGQPAPFLFANAPSDELPGALAEMGIDAASWDTYVSPYPCLLLESGPKKILVDTGAGKMGPSTGRLVATLRSAGVSPAEIDLVVLTHVHPDHVGGVTTDQGDPQFPNARYLISRTEWDFWTNSPDLSSLPVPEEFRVMLRACADTQLPPLANVVDFVAPGDELVSGVSIFSAEGHTPGQIGVRVASEEKRLHAVADAIVLPVHVSRPEWCTAVDIDAPAAVQTRRRIMARAVEEEALVFAYHFPSPGLGYIQEAEDGWSWKPIET